MSQGHVVQSRADVARWIYANSTMRLADVADACGVSRWCLSPTGGGYGRVEARGPKPIDATPSPPRSKRAGRRPRTRLPSYQPQGERIECPTCGRLTAVNPSGTMRLHVDPDGRTCSMSRRPILQPA